VLKRIMKILVLGSPGVGKGTYTSALVKAKHLVHISTGDLFRNNIKNQTELGKKVKEYLDSGALVPDELTIALVKDRLEKEDCKFKGFILDGFPRTIPQADALEQITRIDLVIKFSADHDVIMSRLTGRMICKGCGEIYHKINIKPKVKGVCDLCGKELYVRDDDTPVSVEKRLALYQEKTAPLIDYYKEKGILESLTFNEDFGSHGEEILRKILEVVNEVENES
jgi:adenylate kinase